MNSKRDIATISKVKKMGVITLERIIDQAKDDIAFSQRLYGELKMNVGSRFRVRDLPKTVSHSGSVFNHFVNVGLLKVVEKKKEKNHNCKHK